MSGQQELLLLLDLPTLHGPVLLLDVSTLLWLELPLNTSAQQDPVLLRDVSTG
jgi:hypothetical protein